ncbi:hypothetical protein LOK49_LG14G02016 [Camellia lanceoleosa]|uniref:Uncharacterized protein n=1 Tax=Camellia lanceoleosa TaxID=1840588 RepID=A0ACC0FCH5_9ERIC|nr:hypothetical protein LOK49_LG14G02016 [Camellia lanceoleosa]
MAIHCLQCFACISELDENLMKCVFTKRSKNGYLRKTFHFVIEEDHKGKRWKLKNWKAILMTDFKEIHSSESGLNTCNRCFQVMLSLQNSSALITEQSDEEDDV